MSLRWTLPAVFLHTPSFQHFCLTHLTELEPKAVTAVFQKIFVAHTLRGHLHCPTISVGTTTRFCRNHRSWILPVVILRAYSLSHFSVACSMQLDKKAATTVFPKHMKMDVFHVWIISHLRLDSRYLAGSSNNKVFLLSWFAIQILGEVKEVLCDAAKSKQSSIAWIDTSTVIQNN